MRYGNYGDLPKRSGTGIKFLLILFFAGLLIMNFLRQQGSTPPGKSQSPGGGYLPGDDRTPNEVKGIQPRTEPSNGLQVMSGTERLSQHPAVGKTRPRSSGSIESKAELKTNGNGLKVERFVNDKKEQRFKSASVPGTTHPTARSTSRGDRIQESGDK